MEKSSGKKGSGNIGSGKQTLRLRASGPATVEIVSIGQVLVIEHMALHNCQFVVDELPYIDFEMFFCCIKL